ncbi:MAG TPA: hypothetical protein VM577_18505 [Anaerovoracaceae bacterium]|nr:hypothetical protein [Anaerovoracaceae bacterium]
MNTINEMLEEKDSLDLNDLPACVQEIMKAKFEYLDQCFLVDCMGLDVVLYSGDTSIKVMAEFENSEKGKLKFMSHMRSLAYQANADHSCMVWEGKVHATKEDVVYVMVEDKDYLYSAVSVVDKEGKLSKWHIEKRLPHDDERMTGIICQSAIDDKGYFNPIRISQKSIKELGKHLSKVGGNKYVRAMYLPHAEGNVQVAKHNSSAYDNPEIVQHIQEADEFLKDNDEGACLYLGFDEIEHQIFQIRQYVKNKKTQKFVEKMKKKPGVVLYCHKKGKWQFVNNTASVELKLEVDKILPSIQ